MAGDEGRRGVFQPLPRFNSRPRVAGDHQDYSRLQVPRVSIHARAWRATPRHGHDHAIRRFQFTPARGGRLRAGKHRLRPRRVSIHARAWRATFDLPGLCKVSGVSIHARAWRATPGRGRVPRRVQVSIHARAWRATMSYSRRVSASVFQFTPARGGRHAREHRERQKHVSIHARAWRATQQLHDDLNYWMFQFTPARGGRRGCAGGDADKPSFNSRPRVAGDRRCDCVVRAIILVSIHARAWRATPDSAQPLRGLHVSIHARAWRATERPVWAASTMPVSIHARAWRATRAGISNRSMTVVSIHARAWRATLSGLAY